MKINYRTLVKYYIILSVFILVGLMAARSAGIGVKFFSILNVLNALFCILLLLFKNKIMSVIDGIIEVFNEIQRKSEWLHINITYKKQWICYFCFFVPAIVFGIYSVYLAFSDTQAYFDFIYEDGVLETVSALSWLFAALCMTVYVIMHKADSRIHGQRKYLIIMIALFILCGGEEISWGQRLIGYSPPDLMMSINLQQETNLHNIGSISVFSNLFFLLTCSYFIVLPIIYWKKKEVLYTLSYFSIPFPERVSICTFGAGVFFWIIIGIRFGTLGFHPFCFYDEAFYTQMDDEIFECYAAYAFFVFSAMRFMTRVDITEARTYAS